MKKGMNHVKQKIMAAFLSMALLFGTVWGNDFQVLEAGEMQGTESPVEKPADSTGTESTETSTENPADTETGPETPEENPQPDISGDTEADEPEKLGEPDELETEETTGDTETDNGIAAVEEPDSNTEIINGVECKVRGNCGKYGDNVKWEFDSITGTLTVYGEGEMEDYRGNPYGNDPDTVVQPWFRLLYELDIIKTVEIKKGVTEIGENAFNKYAVLEFHSNINKVIIPDSVEVIRGGAFCYCNGPGSITIPASVRYIGSMAFHAGTPMLIMEGPKPVTEPDFRNDQMYQQIKVACNYLTEYKSDPTWNSIHMKGQHKPVCELNESGDTITFKCVNEGCGAYASITLIAPDRPQSYTGNEIKPVTIKVGGSNENETDNINLWNDLTGQTAVPDDSQIIYEKNIDPGTASAKLVIKYKENDENGQEAEKEITAGTSFEIKLDIGSARITLQDLTYNGTLQTVNPSVSIEENGVTRQLTSGKDYTVTGNSGTDAGTYTVTVTGMGDFTGELKIEFKIKPKTLTEDNIQVQKVPHWDSDVSAVEPGIIVKDKDTVLTPGKDYTLAYSDNTKIGTATVTVTGQGNYDGTPSRTFEIEGHTFRTECKDENTHWEVCGCGKTKDPEPHNYDGDTDMDCNDCGYNRTGEDKTAPAGSIEITLNGKTETWNSYTAAKTPYTLFSRTTEDVMVTAWDVTDGGAVSGIKGVYYYISESPLSLPWLEDFGNASWSPAKMETKKARTGTGSVQAAVPTDKWQDSACIVYVKIMDNNGNSVILSTDWLVFDGTDPEFSGIKNGKTYYTPQTVTVSDSWLASVTVNTEAAIKIDSTASADEGTWERKLIAEVYKKTKQTITAVDEAGNSTTVTFYLEIDPVKVVQEALDKMEMTGATTEAYIEKVLNEALKEAGTDMTVTVEDFKNNGKYVSGKVIIKTGTEDEPVVSFNKPTGAEDSSSGTGNWQEPAGPQHKHNYGKEWKSDRKKHWHECECGKKTDVGEHAEDNGTVTKKPTATEAGVRTYRCILCGRVLRTEIIPSAGKKDEPVFVLKLEKAEKKIPESKPSGTYIRSPKTGQEPWGPYALLPAMGFFLLPVLFRRKRKKETYGK